MHHISFSKISLYFLVQHIAVYIYEMGQVNGKIVEISTKIGGKSLNLNTEESEEKQWKVD